MVSFSRDGLTNSQFGVFFFINQETHYSFDEKIHSDTSKIRQKLAVRNSKLARSCLRYFPSMN